MNETSKPFEGGAPKSFEGRKRLPAISLQLHEAIGICLLFQNAPAELIGELCTDDAEYGLSAAYGYLRIFESVAELFGDEESKIRIAAERAMLDQVQEGLT